MNNSSDFLRKKFGPLKARNLKNAIAQQIATEFPRIGGPRIFDLCAEMIMELVSQHMRSREHITHGQVLWAAVDINDMLHINEIAPVSASPATRRRLANNSRPEPNSFFAWLIAGNSRCHQIASGTFASRTPVWQAAI